VQWMGRLWGEGAGGWVRTISFGVLRLRALRFAQDDGLVWAGFARLRALRSAQDDGLLWAGFARLRALRFAQDDGLVWEGFPRLRVKSGPGPGPPVRPEHQGRVHPVGSQLRLRRLRV